MWIYKIVFGIKEATYAVCKTKFIEIHGVAPIESKKG
jgi:hypothetical protein